MQTKCSAQVAKFETNLIVGKHFFQADRAIFYYPPMQYLISASFPDVYHSFQFPEPQNLSFMVSMERAKKGPILW